MQYCPDSVNVANTNGVEIAYCQLSPLILESELCSRIAALATQSSPHEICGYVSGAGGRALEIHPIPNVAIQPEIEFLMDPQAQLNALIAVEDSGQHIIAVYHSHPPNVPPILSEKDFDGQAHSGYMNLVATPDSTLTFVTFRAFKIVGNRVLEVKIVPS